MCPAGAEPITRCSEMLEHGEMFYARTEHAIFAVVVGGRSGCPISCGARCPLFQTGEVKFTRGYRPWFPDAVGAFARDLRLGMHVGQFCFQGEELTLETLSYLIHLVDQARRKPSIPVSVTTTGISFSDAPVLNYLVKNQVGVGISFDRSVPIGESDPRTPSVAALDKMLRASSYPFAEDMVDVGVNAFARIHQKYKDAFSSREEALHCYQRKVGAITVLWDVNNLDATIGIPEKLEQFEVKIWVLNPPLWTEFSRDAFLAAAVTLDHEAKRQGVVMFVGNDTYMFTPNDQQRTGLRFYTPVGPDLLPAPGVRLSAVNGQVRVGDVSKFLQPEPDLVLDHRFDLEQIFEHMPESLLIEPGRPLSVIASGGVGQQHMMSSWF